MKRSSPIDGLVSWPVLKQIARRDVRALGDTAHSARSLALEPRIKSADKLVKSICPYCAVGCGQDIYVKNGKITNVEGDPDSPVSRGRLCPKGAATFQLVTGSHRVQQVLYRAPRAVEWTALPLESAMDMVAERMRRAREETWEERGDDGSILKRSLGIAHLGGATLDNEENYLIKKLFTAAGAVQIENQARI